MSINRKSVVNDAYGEAYSLIKNEDKHVRFDEMKKFIRAKTNLTDNEKVEVIKRFDGDYDYFKVVENDGIRRTCEECNEQCLATLYCEYCIRNYLKENFSNWSSGNDEIDNVIKKCQRNSLIPYMIVEWIPFKNFQNIKHLADGGCSEIYSANWNDGCYKEWDSREKKLKRGGPCKVALKKLENIEKADRYWFDEASTHLSICNKWGNILQCYGITKDPSDGKFILVMNYMDVDLRKYIKDNRNEITWKTKIKIVFEIIKAVRNIHRENSIHRDLHSGNVLYLQEKNDWYISDLGFCGPIDKPLRSIYGNLPYIAPEVLSKNDYSFKSDIYSIAMIMWELSAERPPFNNLLHNHDNYDLIINIINGIRPQFVPGTPEGYRNLMKQCWDADPDKRPDIVTLWNTVDEIDKSLRENDEYWSNTNSPKNDNFNIDSISSLIENPRSKLFQLSSNLPNPKNATEEEQETYYSTQINLNIPNDMLISSSGST